MKPFFPVIPQVLKSLNQTLRVPHCTSDFVSRSFYICIHTKKQFCFHSFHVFCRCCKNELAGIGISQLSAQRDRKKHWETRSEINIQVQSSSDAVDNIIFTGIPTARVTTAIWYATRFGTINRNGVDGTFSPGSTILMKAKTCTRQQTCRTNVYIYIYYIVFTRT